MIHRICIAVAVALLCVAVALIPASASVGTHDPDSRPCVSHREWKTINHTAHPWRPRAVDRFTEVAGAPVTEGTFYQFYGFDWYTAPGCNPSHSALFGYDPTTKRLRALAWVDSSVVAAPASVEPPTPTPTTTAPPRPTPTAEPTATSDPTPRG